MPVKNSFQLTMNEPLKKYRIQFRIWKNDLRLKRESRYYEGTFASRHLKIPDEETIRQEMRKRFPHIRLKDRGTFKIITIYHHYAWENESLRPSLEKFRQVYNVDAEKSQVINPGIDMERFCGINRKHCHHKVSMGKFIHDYYFCERSKNLFIFDGISCLNRPRNRGPER